MIVLLLNMNEGLRGTIRSKMGATEYDAKTVKASQSEASSILVP
jgi:hypothetical protein